MKLVGDEFEDTVNHYGREWWPAGKVVEKAVEERLEVHPSGKVIHLKCSCGGRLPWKSHLHAIENSQNLNILFIIYEDQNNHWNIASVPEQGTSRNHCDLPLAWWGLPEEELRKVSGIKGIKFVHPRGFRGSTQLKEDVLVMAE